MRRIANQLQVVLGFFSDHLPDVAPDHTVAAGDGGSEVFVGVGASEVESFARFE